MPGSPSDGRGKWKRRKREPQIARKPKHEEVDDEEDDNDESLDREDSEEPNQNLLSAAVAADLRPQEVEVLAEGGVRICDFPVVVRHTVSRPHSSVMAVVAAERANLVGDSVIRGQVAMELESVSYGQLQAVSRVPAESIAAATTGGNDQERSDGGNLTPPYVITPPPILECGGIAKRFESRVHVVPMHSDWFSPASIHRLERQVVPLFFSGKSPNHTPEKYMECRNFIVATYMENPEKMLTISDCQGYIVGVDNTDLRRIFRFLDHWGIINYCTAAPNCEPLNGGSYLREDPGGEIHVPSDALKSIESLIKFDLPKCRLKATDVYSSMSGNVDDFSGLDDRIRERLSDYHCNSCSQPLPSIYYQSHKEADVLLCSDCFHDGKFVIGHSSIDFVRTDSTKDYGDTDGENWRDQETLLLLEAIEIYSENWNEIAEHVGTKSKSQCILHFLRLPMEDGKLENIEVPSMAKSSNASNIYDRRSLHSTSNGSSPNDDDPESRLPFANSGNPVMSLVAFLASAVGPRVAAACAHASLVALAVDNSTAAAGNIVQRGGSVLDSRINLDGMHGREGSFYGDLANSIQQKEGNSAVHVSRVQNEAQFTPISAEKVEAAAKAGLAAAAVKAKLFADHEEREIQRLYASVVNQQLKRLELKLKQFAEVEALLTRELELVEKTRLRFAGERARILAARFGGAAATSQISMPGVSPPIVNNSIGSHRPQVVSASLSQPSISSYGNNQLVRPQMPFMPRLSMFL
ncbi:SWI/SNF complex subunit SWI3C isoform X3 [Tripterygium wilfordii]|uniref:SWI/SNF complex subunit SWI3C isoform X3 n=1 Tax=Tripterygium wilfordii TaxID=458696 RepID=A0A7J7CN44_TRIWF|nr:SWI/SNF complex subunit SWI3C-like [Tripterygium wilfordii]KAF5735490.1 SWI/SNF complex subunit SWI3C isoform X3 [Tripterygium wilfordii]